jgi:hypothetical protein
VRGGLAALALALALVALTSSRDAPGSSGNPLLNLESADRTPWVGSVEEVADAGGYAYLRVRGQWIATLNDGFEPGRLVEIRPIGRARGWHSSRLKRSFDDVLFAAVSYAPTAGSGAAP